MDHHIVLLEDDQHDAALIERELRNGGIDAIVDTAPNRSQFESLLSSTKVDLVLSDSAVGDFSALDAVRITKTMQPSSEFIIVSSHMDEARAEQARLMGAIEWIRKSDLAQLSPLVRMTLEASRARDSNTTGSQPIIAQTALPGKQARRLVEAITALSHARDLESVQRIVTAAAREINNADGATFVLREGTQCFYADEDAIAPLWKGRRFPMSVCISGWTMLHRRPTVIPDIALDSRISPDVYRSTFVKSMAMVPIRNDAPIGAIGNYWATHHEPTDSEIEMIQLLANSAAIAMENVSRYHQLESRVAERTQQLEDTNESLREFSYFVSHDLRSPVRQIGAFVDILEEETAPLTAAGKHALGAIKSSVVRMNAMLEGLLNLAKLGNDSVAAAEVNMRTLANAVAQQALERSVTAVKITIQDMPPCMGDETLLHHVWTNLLTNAIKFSAKRPVPSIVVGCERVRDENHYFVSDNGAGFDSSKTGYLFTAFHRLHSNSEFPGSGVGLAIAHRIVTRHRGRIWATSDPDRGAKFCFTIGTERQHSTLQPN
jgi:signal transduction histidine kinase/DNA-binding NarL/FixJ family response regulator